jgi:1-acyl-sn-glycerol-3-phosphate acyltransferase
VWLSYVLIASVLVLLGATPRWIDSAPEPRQRIYFANHTSHIDTVALWSALPARQDAHRCRRGLLGR